MFCLWKEELLSCKFKTAGMTDNKGSGYRRNKRVSSI